MVGDLGADEMAHQQRDAVVVRLHPRRQRGRLARGDAEAVHAGVDMQRRAAAPIVGGDEGIPFRKLGDAVDHRARVEFDERRAAARRETVEHIDDRLGRDRTHASRFGEIGDEKGLAAGLGELRRDRFEPAAIGVGLDHGGAIDGDDPARQRAPIDLDRREIDRERAAGLGLGRNGRVPRLRFGFGHCHDRVIWRAARLP